MSGHSQGYGRRDHDAYASSYSHNDYHSRRDEGSRNSYDYYSEQKHNYSEHNSRDGEGGGYGSEGGSSGYSRARNDYQISTNDNYGGGYNRSSNNYHRGSGGGNDMRLETQYDTIFIQNLPRNVTAFELKNVFSQIGMIRNDKKTGAPKIWIYKDKTTGEGKGEATITYEDEAAAQAAINWYDGKEVLSNIVHISLATRRAQIFGGGRGGSRNRGGFRNRGAGGADYGGYRGRGGNYGSDHRSGGEYRGGGRGASHGSSRDNRFNPY